MGRNKQKMGKSADPEKTNFKMQLNIFSLSKKEESQTLCNFSKPLNTQEEKVPHLGKAHTSYW